MSNEIQSFDTTPAVQSRSAGTEMVISRQAQEVQAAMVIAKRFPRDEIEAYNRIIRACSRKALAESAMYEYPRGGQKVTGPSIRLAEVLAQSWGNIDYGVIELEQKNSESQMMAYAWDLETNTRQTKIFAVPHKRKANKQIKELDDPRDIYELTANQGARRVRSCILGIIPGDIIESAIKQCEVTIVSGESKPLTDRAREMVAAFDKLGVTQAMLEKNIGCNMDAFSLRDILKLGKIYNSLKDGMSNREDYFELPKPKSAAEEEFKKATDLKADKKKDKENGGDAKDEVEQGKLL